ncbi:TRAP transporter substrate-binding protein DctP [Thalassovita sp.]|uniref:TRAP transporter substrate-binding protein DctP n=1 Tax=Thalassovita sp. TaxID=1979401 RepID=UPI0029DE72DE|nr:TRAP transporter substrate-binding protein DctP [Thalassovita sp.]
MFKKIVMSGLLAAGLMSPAAQAETVLRAFAPVSESRPEGKMFQSLFSAKVEELSGGDLKIQTFYAGGLGFEVKDLLRHMKKNTVDIGMVLGAYYPRDAEALSLMLVDGALTTADNLEAYRNVFSEGFDESLDRWGVVNVGFMQPLILDHAIYCKEPVTTLEQLRTKKLRTWTKHQLETFKAMGVSAQMLPKEDLYVALQTGVVDCAIYLGEVATLLGLHEVAPYETYMLPFISAPAGIGISQISWDKLSDEQRAIISEAGAYATVESTKQAIAFGQNKEQARADRSEKGIIITEGFSDADREAIVTSMRETWKVMAKEAGPDTVALVDRVLAVKQ